MSLLLSTVLPALLPALSDGVRGLVGKFTGGAGANPQNVDEVIKLQEAETQRLEALAKLDSVGGGVSPWVANLRASSRYIAVWVALAQWPIVLWLVPEYADTGAQFAQSAFFFLFGDRVYLHLKRGT